MSFWQKLQQTANTMAADAQQRNGKAQQNLLDKKLKCVICGTQRLMANSPHCKHCGASFDEGTPDLKVMVKAYRLQIGFHTPEQAFQKDATELACYGWRPQAQSSQGSMSIVVGITNSSKLTVSYIRD